MEERASAIEHAHVGRAGEEQVVAPVAEKGSVNEAVAQENDTVPVIGGLEKHGVGQGARPALPKQGRVVLELDRPRAQGGVGPDGDAPGLQIGRAGVGVIPGQQEHAGVGFPEAGAARYIRGNDEVDREFSAVGRIDGPDHRPQVEVSPDLCRNDRGPQGGSRGRFGGDIPVQSKRAGAGRH